MLYNIKQICKKTFSIKKRHDYIKRLAYSDSLTGLHNRAFLVDSINKILKKPNNSGLFVFVDLDNFKLINDIHGHNFGDKYLKQTANKLTNITKNACDNKNNEFLVARLGGDEFAIIITANWKPKDSISFLKSIHNAVTGVNGNGKASIGAARYPHDANNLNDLINLADKEMYKAKRNKKNQYQLYGY